MTGARTRGIALGGFMGVGKSTVGRLVAAELGLPFVDLDELLVARFGPIDAQLSGGDSSAFRAREHDLLCAQCDAPPHVLATGGCAWVDGRNRAQLARAFVRVVLRAPLSVLRDRVGAGHARPLWDDRVAERFAERQAAYGDADVHISTDSRTPTQVAQRVIVAYREALP